MSSSGARRPSQIKVLPLILGLGVTFALVAVLASGFGNDPHALPKALEQQRAPTFTLTDLDGNQVDLADYVGKGWVVVNFWSTWCGPCKMEHPILVEAPKHYPDVTWLGVLYNDDPAKAVRYLESAGTSYPHLIDAKGRAAVDYGVTGVPETFFISPEGVVVKKYVQPIGAKQIMEILGPPRTQPAGG